MSETDKKTRRVSPDVSQGIYPGLGTIRHTDPQTAQGSSPGTVTSILKRDTGPAAKPKSPDLTTPSGSQPAAKGVTHEATKRVKHESPATRLRRKEGR